MFLDSNYWDFTQSHSVIAKLDDERDCIIDDVYYTKQHSGVSVLENWNWDFHFVSLT